jgi:hypothetical protein
MLPPKSRDHRLRVLENLVKAAAEREDASRQEPRDPQMRMPLIVEVKSKPTAKQRARRSPRSRAGQPKLGDL